MADKIIVGPITKGLRTDRKPFAIDNDSFPTLINAYQWRGRIRRKRGTSFLGRLTRRFQSTSTAFSTKVTFPMVAGVGNVLSSYITSGDVQTTATLVPGTISIRDLGAPNEVFTDPAANGILVGSLGASGTINYASGAVTISTGTTGNFTAFFNYYPNLPVMGLEDFIPDPTVYPGTIAFDTVYSYGIASAFPYAINNVSFYKNPISDSTLLPGYTPKLVWTPTTWNGQDYQQFWTTNFSGALWATNGINVPFDITNIGMQYAPTASIVFVSNTVNTITVTITPVFPLTCDLVVGDFVFFNEWTSATPINAQFLNFQTGYVTVVAGTPASLTVTVRFPNATLPIDAYSPGIIQYLTNRSDVTKDTLRWYDGDPTNGNPTNPTFLEGKGWVNFMPPLSRDNFSIADTPQAQYYLVGARIIQEYKDRLLFLGPVIQRSTGSPIYLPDTVVYSQNGTPYYTSSFTGDPSLANTLFFQVLVPTNQTATATAYWEDQTGFGGFQQIGIGEPIITCASVQDVLILGLPTTQVRLIYTGNDITPFNFFLIDSELGDSSTFSMVNMGRGKFARGDRGITLATQSDVERVDVDILDKVMEMDLNDKGAERITAFRDFINEWIYLTYPSNQNRYKFPTETLQYNYRDQSWAVFKETYTHYGNFRKQTGFTWATVGSVYPTWRSWTTAWNASTSTLLAPEVIAGNQQGFIVVRDDGTNESNSLYIATISFPTTITGISKANPAVILTVNQFVIGQQILISGVSGMTQINGLTVTVTNVSGTSVTTNLDTSGGGFSVYTSGGIATPLDPVYSPNHCLVEGDYIVLSGITGTLSTLNDSIFSIGPKPSQNGFTTNPEIDAGTYLGGGLIKRMYNPFVQTKQFPTGWMIGRKTRIGMQQYLLTVTDKGQISLLIYLSQNSSQAFNEAPIVPKPNSVNNALIYSTVLFTCPESTNLGLLPFNANMQKPANANLLMNAPASTIAGQGGVTGSQQLWHRINTSLIGDTIQLGFTMSDAQMRDTNFNNQFVEIELHGFNMDISPSQMLC